MNQQHKYIFSALTVIALSVLPAMADVGNASLYFQGVGLDKKGNTAGAYAIAERMIAGAPNDSMGYKLRAELNAKHGKPELAKQDADKCMQLINAEVMGLSRNSGAASPQAYSAPGVAASSGHATWDSLTPNGPLELNKSASKDPLETDLKMGVQYANSGQWQQALTSFNSALKQATDPETNAAILEQRSHVYAQLNQPGNALADLKRYQQLQTQQANAFVSNYHKQADKDAASGKGDLRTQVKDFLDNKARH